MNCSERRIFEKGYAAYKLELSVVVQLDCIDFEEVIPKIPRFCQRVEGSPAKTSQ